MINYAIVDGSEQIITVGTGTRSEALTLAAQCAASRDEVVVLRTWRGSWEDAVDSGAVSEETVSAS